MERTTWDAAEQSSIGSCYPLRCHRLLCTSSAEVVLQQRSRPASWSRGEVGDQALQLAHELSRATHAHLHRVDGCTLRANGKCQPVVAGRVAHTAANCPAIEVKQQRCAARPLSFDLHSGARYAVHRAIYWRSRRKHRRRATRLGRGEGRCNLPGGRRRGRRACNRSGAIGGCACGASCCCGARCGRCCAYTAHGRL